MLTLPVALAAIGSLCMVTAVTQAASPIAATVSVINAMRARHGVPPVRLDYRISGTAQRWANHLLATKRLRHRPGNRYGENLFWAGGGDRSAEAAACQAVAHWYGEGNGYDYHREYPAGANPAPDFTALLWESVDRVGVGIAPGQDGTYVVVNFAPAGNVQGQFTANVRPPQ